MKYVNEVMNKRTLQAVMSVCRIHARAADRIVITAIVIAIATLLIVNLAFRMVSYLFSDTMEKTAILLLLLLNTLHMWTKNGDVDGGVKSSANKNRYTRLSKLCQTEGRRISPKLDKCTDTYKSDLANSDKQTPQILYDAQHRSFKITRHLSRTSCLNQRPKKGTHHPLRSPFREKESSMPKALRI